mmetsp:Transcript_9697/g.29883  ORF Transcript_9697/g.29883 Transcript_9697/m.29883 type:complete len:228 (+) Transcript_9697:2481-3164(+)
MKRIMFCGLRWTALKKRIHDHSEIVHIVSGLYVSDSHLASFHNVYACRLEQLMENASTRFRHQRKSVHRTTCSWRLDEAPDPILVCVRVRILCAEVAGRTQIVSCGGWIQEAAGVLVDAKSGHSQLGLVQLDRLFRRCWIPMKRHVLTVLGGRAQRGGRTLIRAGVHLPFGIRTTAAECGLLLTFALHHAGGRARARTGDRLVVLADQVNQDGASRSPATMQQCGRR